MSYGVLSKYDTGAFLSTFRIQVEKDLKVFISLHDKEPDKALINELKKINFPFNLTITPESETGIESIILLQKLLSEFSTAIDSDMIDNLAEEYRHIYLNHTISASPNKPTETDCDNHYHPNSIFHVHNWYKKYNLVVSDWQMRPNDHLVYELQYIISLLNQDNKPETMEHLATFLDEHLLLWIGNFSKYVQTHNDAHFFTWVVCLTAAYCEELRDVIAELLEQPRPTKKEIEIRMQSGHKRNTEMVIPFVPSIMPAI